MGCYTTEVINEQEEQLGDFIEHSKTSVLKDEDADDDTSILKTVQLKRFCSCVNFGKTNKKSSCWLSLAISRILSNFEIELNTKPQPAFNRQFDLLIKDLKAHESKGYEFICFCRAGKAVRKIEYDL